MSSICDFCSTQPVTWSYPARSFIAYVVGGIGGESVGSWAACEICHLLIESGDTEALADRAVETLSVRHPEIKALGKELLQEMKILHRSFLDHRVGSALPVRSIYPLPQ